jgi:UDPglucose 6-dehydrogenase
MKIGIIGVGYVGLVSGACFSDFGHKVVCIDRDVKKIERLRNGESPIYEPGLEEIIDRNVMSKRLSFETDISNSIKDVEVIFIAVGTPTRRGNGHADLTSVFEVFTDIKNLVGHNQTVVIKSTVPVGTNKKAQEIMNDGLGTQFDVVSNPEFLREGSAIEDFMKPDRVVIGLRSEEAKKVMAEVYKPLYLRDFPIVYTDPESAELIKYASNGFLALKISFINEIAALCENVGANVKEVANGMGLDGRIGRKFLHAGPGYGGSCFPKDTLALATIGKECGVAQEIVETVIAVNNKTKLRMIDKIVSVSDGTISKKTITFLGVTFKPNTDDMREAPSLTIIPAIMARGAKVNVVDPKGIDEGKDLLQGVIWFDNPYEAAKESDLVVILTEWNEFRALDLQRLAKLMKTPVMADLRNIYSEAEVLSSGFIRYSSVGR